MIIYSKANNSINLYEKEINAFAFQTSEQFTQFIEGVIYYSKYKGASPDISFHIMNNHYEDIKKSQIFPVLMNCGIYQLEEEKEFKDALLKSFEEQLYSDRKSSQKFYELEVKLNELLSELSITSSHYNFDYLNEKFHPKNLMKLLTIDYHLDSEDLLHHQKRELYLDYLLRTKPEDKDAIIFIIYPELFLAQKELDTFIKNLKNRKETVVLITGTIRVLKEINIRNINLIKKDREKYDIIDLMNELELFNLQDKHLKEIQAIHLSFHDFTSNEIFLHEKYREFLSN